MNPNQEFDFDLLIKVSLEIGNLLKGKKIPDDKIFIYYAEGLGKKIENHILSARYLCNGYILSIGKDIYKPIFDFSSIAVLTRAALESYLTFNHIFIAPKNIDESKFRFMCWDLAGYIDRTQFITKDEKYKTKIESERLSIERLNLELKQNDYFKNLNKKNQEKILKGQWKIDKFWSDFAIHAGFSTSFFRQQYSFLCGYAHSSRLSIMQIQQGNTTSDQNIMIKSFVSVLMVVLAKYTFDYIELIPELKQVKEDLKRYPIIYFWKTVGERINHTESENKVNDNLIYSVNKKL